MPHLACHLSPRPLPWWITNPTPYAAHPYDFNLTTTRRSRSIDKFSGEYCEFLFGQQFNHETCCPWPTIFCHPSLWIANPAPPSVPSHNVNKMTNKTDSGQFPFPVRWVWSFLFNNYLKRDAPHLPSSAPLHELRTPCHEQRTPVASIPQLKEEAGWLTSPVLSLSSFYLPNYLVENSFT